MKKCMCDMGKYIYSLPAFKHLKAFADALPGAPDSVFNIELHLRHGFKHVYLQNLTYIVFLHAIRVVLLIR